MAPFRLSQSAQSEADASMSSDYRDVDEEPNHASSQLIGPREVYLDQVKEDGFMPLIEAIWREEVAVNNSITCTGGLARDQDTLYFSFKTMAEQTFCSMGDEVVDILGRGNIALRYHAQAANDPIRLYIDEVTKGAKEMPSIYVRALINNKKASAPKEMLGMADWALLYTKPFWECSAAEKKLINDVERRNFDIRLRDICSGTRSFAEDSSQRIETIKNWATIIKNKMEALLPVELKQPLARPPTHTGYAKVCENRIKSHLSGGTSIFIKIALAYFEHTAGEDMFDFQNMPVVLLAEQDKAAVAEVVVAGFTNSPSRFGVMNNAHCGNLRANLNFDWADN